MTGQGGTMPRMPADDRRDTAPAALPAAYAHCAALVREHDQDRYIACLYAPEAQRPALFALYAFSHEIARVRALVSEPLPGEVRLQWWRDLLEGEPKGEAQAHPVAAALLDAVARYRLPIAPLTGLIEARVFDLYDDPMPSLSDLRRLCRRDLERPDPAGLPHPRQRPRSRRRGGLRPCRRRLCADRADAGLPLACGGRGRSICRPTCSPATASPATTSCADAAGRACSIR